MIERRDMTRKALWLLGCALAAGLIAAGCGGDDDDDGGGEQTAADGAPTKAEFIAQANEICAKGVREITEEAGKVLRGGQPTPEQVREFVTGTLVPRIRKRLDQLRELRPPEGDEDRVDAIFDAAENAADQLEEDPTALTGGARAFAEANRVSLEYGLRSCTGRT